MYFLSGLAIPGCWKNMESIEGDISIIEFCDGLELSDIGDGRECSPFSLDMKRRSSLCCDSSRHMSGEYSGTEPSQMSSELHVARAIRCQQTECRCRTKD